MSKYQAQYKLDEMIGLGDCPMRTALQAIIDALPADPVRFTVVEFIEHFAKELRKRDGDGGAIAAVRLALLETNNALQETWGGSDRRNEVSPPATAKGRAMLGMDPAPRCGLRPDQFKVNKIKLAFITDVFPPFMGDQDADILECEAIRQLTAEGFVNTSGVHWWPKWRKKGTK